MGAQENDKTLTQIVERLIKLEEALQHVKQRVDQLETSQPILRSRQVESTMIQELDLMNLPDNLRRTMIAVVNLKEATPEEVAEVTNRTRGLENIYLNQLEMLGYIEKTKKGRRVYYRNLRIA